jgi:ankyrin repeat protein
VRNQDLIGTLVSLTLHQPADDAVRQVLILAAKNGWAEVVVAMLEDCPGADASASNRFGYTPLGEAARHGHIALVKILLGWNAFPHHLDMHHQSPVYYAAENGHLDVLTILLADSRVDPVATDKFDMTPFAVAAHNGHEAIMKRLIDDARVRRGASDPSSVPPTTILGDAASSDRAAIVSLLLSCDWVELNGRDKYQRTALHVAAAQGHSKIM